MEDNKKEYELVVTPGKLPLWRIVVAAILFGYLIYTLCLLVVFFYDFGFDKDTIKVIPGSLGVLSYCLTGGIVFSITKTVLIDVDQDKLISRFAVGPFSRDVLTTVPELEYISVFMNSKEEYEVNLWYVGNKHYNMYTFFEKEPALKFGNHAALKLNIDLLDATERGNNKWVEKQTL